MADLIVKGGSILTMDGTVIESGMVAVDNGLITSVGKDTDEKAERTINAKGCIVMPGLINAHTHLSMTLFRGFADGLPYGEWIKKIKSAEAKLTPADVRTGAYLGALEMIRTGTTAFADMYIHMDEVAQVVEEIGMRAALGYGMIEGLNEDSEAKLKSREKFVRKWSGAAGGRITTMYAPHSALSCSREFLTRVKELAVKDNSRIHTHVLETEDELRLMKKRYGMCSVNLLDSIGLLGPNVLAAHCIWLSDGDIDILGNRGVNVAHCPSSNTALGVGTAPVPRMLERGINIALGTDGAASSGSLDMWKEIRAASLLHRFKDTGAMLPPKVLEMATASGARALGVKAGVLRPGYLADIILIDALKHNLTPSNLISAHGASGCNIKTAIAGGKILMENYRVEVLDEEKVMGNAKDAVLKIAGDN